MIKSFVEKDEKFSVALIRANDLSLHAQLEKDERMCCNSSYQQQNQ